MIYRVFLDTNIYDKANYSFRNAQVSRLVDLASEKRLQLVINSVVEGEVREHIKDRVKQAVATLKKAAKDRSFAAFRKAPGFSEKLSINHDTDWITFAQNEFTEFLNSCSVRRISLNGISVESVFEDYFHQRAPFEQKKPHEFKDAIAVKSLVLDMKDASNDYDLIQYCVVSADKGFVEAVKTAITETEIEDYTLIFDSLTGFTDYLAEMDKQMQFMLRYLQSEFGGRLLNDAISDALEGASYEIETDDEIVDQEVVAVDIVYVTPHAVSLTSTSGTPDYFDIVAEGEAVVVVDYTYYDYDQSVYDNETHSFIYLVSNRISATHEVSFSMPMSFIVSNCLASDEEIHCDDDEVFREKEMELDYYDKNALDLTEDHLVSFSIIESQNKGTYSICPDCGCRIGIENDGGNGFCVDCAPNH